MYTKKEPNKRKIILPNMVIWQASESVKYFV